VDRFWERPYGLRFAVGIEDTFVPQVSPGLRSLDEYELTGHYDNWRADLDLAASSGASMIRYGIPWYRVNPGPDEWDWSWTDRVIDYLLSLELDPIVDLMHYGCPLWLEREFANRDYPHHVAEYAARFAGRYGATVHLYTPMNEPLLNAMYCGEDGRWPPTLTGDEGFVLLTRQLARGIVETQRAVVDTADDPVFVHVEATFRYMGGVGHAELIRFLRQRTWLIYDLLFGRVDGDHPLYDYLSYNGFSDEDFAFFREHATEPDILGINYYPHMSTTAFLPEGKRRNVWSGTQGIEELVRDFYARYGKPIFWTETSVPGTVEARVRWLEDSLALVHRLRSEGIPLVGYTWWPLFSLLDWAYREGQKPPEAYLWHMGMYDLEPDGGGNFLRTKTPVVDAFRAATGRTSER
jgi:beta-glucosidase/6-phospho-beta-glucosidase/beta-galactosidase